MHEEEGFTLEVDPDKEPFELHHHHPYYKSNDSVDGINVTALETTTQDILVEPDYETAYINGTVTEANSDDGIQGVSVTAINKSGDHHTYFETQTNESGFYSVEVPKGNTTVEFSADQYADDESSVEAPEEEHDVELVQRGRLTVSVTDTDDDPIEEIGVNVIDPTDVSSPAHGKTDENGEFSADLPEGDYWIHVYDDTHDTYADDFESEVEVSNLSDTDAPFELTKQSYITGTVVDEDGDSLPARITGHDSTFTRWEQDTTDPDGEFELLVTPGTYTVTAEDVAWSDPTYADQRVTDIDIDAGETEDVGEVVLPEAGSISGTVTNESGHTVEGAVVMADRGDHRVFEHTNSSGDYHFALPPGTYQVSAFDEGMATPTAVEIESGESATADFDLTSIEVVNTSLTKTEGPGDVDNLTVKTKPLGKVLAFAINNESQDMMAPQELEYDGVNESTRFTVEVAIANFSPDSLLWAGSDVAWEATENETTGTTNVTIEVSPVTLQGTEGVSGGPLLDRSPDGVEWPSNEDDRAAFGHNHTIAMGLVDNSMASETVRENLAGMTVTTNAHTFAPPVVEDDEMRVWVAGPHLTVDGKLHDGFYRAFIPDATLDDWGVDDPEEDLTSYYQGDTADFDVDDEPDDGAWIELDITYSAGYVTIEPDVEEPDQDDSDDSSTTSTGGSSAAVGSDSDPEPETIDDPDEIAEVVDVPEDVEPERAAVTEVAVNEETGQAIAELGEATSTKRIAFDDTDDLEGEVITVDLDSEPANAGEAPGSSVSVAQIVVPEKAEDQSATIRSQVSNDRVDEFDAEPEELRMHRFNDEAGEWQGLDTEVLDETGEHVVIEAETPGFSYFAVSAVSEPVAVIDAPTTTEVAEEVSFNGGRSNDEHGNLTSYEWSIDGETLTGETVSVAFEEAGDYPIELTVINDAGESDTATTTLRVKEGVDDTPEEDRAVEESEGDGIPGFGVVAAILVLLATIAVLPRPSRN